METDGKNIYYIDKLSEWRAIVKRLGKEEEKERFSSAKSVTSILLYENYLFVADYYHVVYQYDLIKKKQVREYIVGGPNHHIGQICIGNGYLFISTRDCEIFVFQVLLSEEELKEFDDNTTCPFKNIRYGRLDKTFKISSIPKKLIYNAERDCLLIQYYDTIEQLDLLTGKVIKKVKGTCLTKRGENSAIYAKKYKIFDFFSDEIIIDITKGANSKGEFINDVPLVYEKSFLDFLLERNEKKLPNIHFIQYNVETKTIYYSDDKGNIYENEKKIFENIKDPLRLILNNSLFIFEDEPEVIDIHGFSIQKKKFKTISRNI